MTHEPGQLACLFQTSMFCQQPCMRSAGHLCLQLLPLLRCAELMRALLQCWLLLLLLFDLMRLLGRLQLQVLPRMLLLLLC